MGSLKLYIFISISSFVSITAIMVLVALVHPRFFSLVPGVFPPDSTAQHQVGASPPGITTRDSLQPLNDSLSAHHARTDSALAQHVPVISEAAPDQKQNDQSMREIPQPVTGERVKLQQPMTAKPDTLSNAELNKMVQIFESMDPENAARILLNMDDDEIRRVLTKMKSRQSAKILATMNPVQAARILKGKKNSW